MPTGYTYKLMEEEGVTFEDYALGCARAMGALIMMRDMDADAPIPEKLSDLESRSGNYHVEELAEAEAHLEELRAMTEQEIVTFNQDTYDKRLASAKEGEIRVNKEQKRLTDMEEQVNAWEPPTADHVGFKEFMLQQLDISKNKRGNYYTRDLIQLADKPITEYHSDAIEAAERSVAYHRESIPEEVGQDDGRQQWIDALRDSLKKQTQPV